VFTQPQLLLYPTFSSKWNGLNQSPILWKTKLKEFLALESSADPVIMRWIHYNSFSRIWTQNSERHSFQRIVEGVGTQSSDAFANDKAPAVLAKGASQALFWLPIKNDVYENFLITKSNSIASLSPVVWKTTLLLLPYSLHSKLLK
jgi:hypothetical protein